jgi:DNA invertase Pin-like site-specific DNA recombinase
MADTLCRDATKRQFDVVMAWNVDRLGRTQRIARPFDGAENASIATAG